MTRNRGPASQHQGRPKPVGWREIVNPKMSRRRFLAGASSAPLLVEPVLAQTAAPVAPLEMALEFDLSDDGSTLDVRQFEKPASPAKGQAQPSTWRTFAQSYGPTAWFEIRVAAADDFDRLVVLRGAKFGEIEQPRFALRFRADVFTEPVPPTPPTAPAAKKPPARQPRRYATEWRVTLETDLWAPPGYPNALWSSKPRPFPEFANDRQDVPLHGEIDPAAASDRLYEMFDERVSSDESPKNALAAAFHADGRWTLERTPEGVAASCFNGRASARKFTFGWYRDGGCAPYFTGFAGADAGDEVKVESPLRLGREGELNVLVRSDGAAARWEVRRAQSLLATAGDGAANPTFQTYAKIKFGAATLDVVEGKATFAAGVPAKTLAVSECDLPVYGAPLRHVLWGDVLAKPSTADFAEIETIVGRLRIDAPEPPAPAASAAAAPAPPSGACLAPQGTAGKDPAQAEAAISAGDRSGALNASLWAVFDRPQGTREYTTRRIAFDFALRGSDLALPDASRSKLVFERGPDGAPPLDHAADPPPEYADLRLLFEDGKPLGFLPLGEYPRREASSFVWLGGLANGAIQARFDLTRATLAAARTSISSTCASASSISR
jgi:hypothetical protein